MNVFLGEPSDTVISYVDKRYYKHTVDAMNNDVSACYKVCEEKSAVIPAEKTSSNLSATIQSIQVGYTSGDIAVPVTGNITGVDSNNVAVQGNIHGSVCGSIYGDICGTVQGNVYSGVCGYVCGDICGGVCGYIGCGNGTAVCGSVYGDICGDVCGICGAVLGNVQMGVCGSIGCGHDIAVCGDVCGDIVGSVTGSVYGYVSNVYCGVLNTVCGDIGQGDPGYHGVYGNVYGSIWGYVQGTVYCGVCGDVCGGICGRFIPTSVTESTVLTLDQTYGDNVLLDIDVCGKQYYIHAN